MLPSPGEAATGRRASRQRRERTGTMSKKPEVETKEISNSPAAAAQPSSNTVNPTQDEQPIITQIQQLWPSARKSGKALGEQLFKLRELCREKDSRFDLLLQSLDIPRSTAYHFIGIFEECQLVDFEFPANIVRFATTAGINLTNLGQRRTLLTAFQEAGSPPEPNDGVAIAIVGSASTAIREAVEEADEQDKPAVPLSPFQKMLAAFTVAQVETYKALVGGKKEIKAMGETTKAAKEAQYVQTIAGMYHLDDSTPAVQQRILSVGRGEQTLQEIYDEWKQLPVTYVMTREKAPIYRQDKGGTTA
jgi:hypothetical protein